MRCVRLGVTLLVGFAFALGVLGPASGSSHLGSKYGGTLVVAYTGNEPGSLDPTRDTTMAGSVASRTFCERLYDIDAKGRIVPQLAAALPVVSRDKLTYTIPLRRGIVFNDGTPFDAQAVVTTMQRYRLDPLSTKLSDFESVESVSAPDASTVVFRLKVPFTPLLDYLATPTGAILSPAQIEKLGDNFGTNPICVGAFTFDHRVAGDSLTVVKSQYYYGRDRVHLDKIVFKYLRDSAAAAALKAGDVHVVDSISPTELPAIRQRSNLRIVERTRYGFQGVLFNLGNRNGLLNLPYTNKGTIWSTKPALRQAFEEAIDRKELARVVFGGHVEPGCTPVSPASRWFDPSIRCTPYDPAHARKLVAASGVSEPTLHLATASDEDERRLVQFIQQQEAAVGIKVVIDPGVIMSGGGVLTSGDFEAGILNWGGRSDPDGNLYAFLATSGSRNRGGYSNPRLDLLLANGRKAATRETRMTIYRVAQELILADRPSIYLYHPIQFAGIDTAQVKGVSVTPDAHLRVAFAQLA